MSNKSVFVNPNLKAQKASRNAFDLGHKRAFHASLGELLPIFHAEVPAGSYIEIGEQNQTYNMNPVIRPAFARIKEHIDYFAVPKVQLWSLYDNFITGQSQFMSSALGSTFLSDPSSERVPSQCPMFDGNFLGDVFEGKYSESNPFGINRLNGTLKLLDLLGYGNFYHYFKNVGDHQEVQQIASQYISPNYLPQNFFGLLAYQKIYYSYYRNSKYESNKPNAYNLDWLPNSRLSLGQGDYTSDYTKFSDIFTLHFRWLKKDYFMSSQPSVLPTSADVGFGGLSSLLMEGQPDSASKFWQIFSLPGFKNSVTNGSVLSNPDSASYISNVSGQNVGDKVYVSSSYANISVSSIRFAFAFDKLLRRMRTAGATFDDQMLAQFGIKPIDFRHGDAFYLGGFTNRLNISEVTQTSDQLNGGLGQFGANVSKYSTNPQKIKYHAKEDCIIMGIYSTSYDVDYPSSRYERDNLRKYRFDFYNPAFENLGLQAIYQGELTMINDQAIIGSDESYAIADKAVTTELLGFNKRYIEYKTKLDTVNGLFDYSNNNATMMAWTTQYRNQYYDATGQLVQRQNTPLVMPLMLVNPIIMNNIVAVNYSGAWENDHFMVNLYNDVSLVANMSIDGEVF